MLDKLWGFVSTTATFVGVACGGILLLLYVFQNKLLYLPDAPNKLPSDNPKGYINPGEHKLEYEDVYVKTKDGVKIHGWFVKMDQPNKYPTVLYFHENAGNIGYRIPFMNYLHKFCQVNVMLFAYRGYSFSEGIPTEEGLQHDAIAAINYIFTRTDVDPEKIFVLGRSLGGAVSIYGLSNTEHKVAGVILENTFTSISDMVDIIFPKLAKLKSLLLRNHWNTKDRIQMLKIPMLFILGLKDELIPTTQMLQLYHSARSTTYKDKFEVLDGGHNDTWTKEVETYFEKINQFIAKCLSMN